MQMLMLILRIKMVKQHYTGVSLNLTINCLKIKEINLLIASEKGNEGIVKLLIDANADVDIKNIYGSTALHMG